MCLYCVCFGKVSWNRRSGSALLAMLQTHRLLFLFIRNAKNLTIDNVSIMEQLKNSHGEDMTTTAEENGSTKISL